MPTAIEWLGQLMAFVRAKPYDELLPDAARDRQGHAGEVIGRELRCRYARGRLGMQTKPTQLF